MGFTKLGLFVIYFTIVTMGTEGATTASSIDAGSDVTAAVAAPADDVTMDTSGDPVGATVGDGVGTVAEVQVTMASDLNAAAVVTDAPTDQVEKVDTGTDPNTPDTDNDDKEPDDNDDTDNNNNQTPPSTTPMSPMVYVPSVHYISSGPLCVTNADCNTTNAERCTQIKQDVMRCQCLAGHDRGSDGSTCVASKVYYVELETEELISDKLVDHSSQTFRTFIFQATDGAFRALKASKLGPILVDTVVSRLSSGQSGHVIIKYEIKLMRSYVPDKVVVTTDIRRAFLDKLVETPGGDQTVLEDTEIPITSAAAHSMQLRDVNPCSHPLMNYCGPTALCIVSARSFTCQCKRGFTDMSIDVHQAPGEECVLDCGCKNGGECLLDDKGNHKCSCPHWYLGSRCGVDVRILLITLAAIVAILLLIAVICCACCLKHWRRKHRQTDDISSVYSVPRQERIHMHKMAAPCMSGRHCYDTWRYYSFSPPAYNSAGVPTSAAPGGGKWQTVAHRPGCASYVPHGCSRRHGFDTCSPIEMVPPTYGTLGHIPRPHVLPQSSLQRPARKDSQQWVWTATNNNNNPENLEESSYA